ncbi:MAG: penicillin-binding protein [Candidatus Marinimicrobia bacterium]|nr:penicillin-binding protein [Candidatus Neomarinimicrobiota bacterium]
MKQWLKVLFSAGILSVFIGGIATLVLFYHFSKGLPDFGQLATYDPSVMTRVYAGNGRLIKEYAIEERVFVPIEEVPSRIINAVVSSEDQRFFSHPGVDPIGLARAVFVVIGEKLSGSGGRMKGASSITQQVAQKFLLGREYSFARKIREAILSLRIERAFTKEHILELYLNESYFGYGAYGVASAALNYFNKSVDELTISESAFLAGILKGPNNYNPVRYPEAATIRRNYVIGRMLEDGHITSNDALSARNEPIVSRDRDETKMVGDADYFAETIRRDLSQRYGDKALYEGGLSVRTSLDPRLQGFASNALRSGLISYDRRHGWRGPIVNLNAGDKTLAQFESIASPVGLMPGWTIALVQTVSTDNASIVLRDGQVGSIPLTELRWAREWLPDQRVGRAVSSASQVLESGDVIVVEHITEHSDGKSYPENTFSLRQIPNIDGAIVAMDPHTGRVLAMVGGFSYERSQFNRATQALRQPGSAFKPFAYLAALNAGFTPSTLVLDAPFVVDQGPGLPKWKPKNYSGEYIGRATLRTGIEKSQNLMTVRLAQAVGMDEVAEVAEAFGIVDQLPHNLSSSLGSEVTTVLRLTAGYAQLANGGRKLEPTFIDRIQDRSGRTIYRADDRMCISCQGEPWEGQEPPQLSENRDQLADPAIVYQMVHILEGVIQNGTGRSIRAIGKPIAGKTGTSNDALDAWFLGFSPDLVVGVFTGFDDPRTLGPRETGSSVAAPIFRSFMAKALKEKPAKPFSVPSGVSLIRVEHDSGLPAQPGDEYVILEAFKAGTSPSTQAAIMGGSDEMDVDGESPNQPNAGGLY